MLETTVELPEERAELLIWVVVSGVHGLQRGAASLAGPGLKTDLGFFYIKIP